MSFSTVGINYTHHKPRQQLYIQRMPPTEGTHRSLHSSQTAGKHTCHPAERHRFSFMFNILKQKKKPGSNCTQTFLEEVVPGNIREEV